MTTTSPGLRLKGALLIAIAIALLFGGIELYGIVIGGDRDVVMPTIAWQLLAITLIVSPMIYGLVYASHHDED